MTDLQHMAALVLLCSGRFSQVDVASLLGVTTDSLSKNPETSVADCAGVWLRERAHANAQTVFGKTRHEK